MKSFRTKISEFMSLTLYTIFSALIWFNFAGELYAQDSTFAIAGSVHDENNVPIPYANVFLNGTLIGDMTDEHGLFAFATKTSQFDTLVCRHIGYRTFSTKLFLRADSAATVEIVLLKATLQGKPVFVTASSYSSGSESHVTLSSLDIVKTPGAAADVMWAVQTFPGVQQVEEGAGLFVRGGDVSETAVILDGAYLFHPYRFESPNGGFFGMISPFLLSGTYFSTGGYGVEYGNALSGVLAMSSQSLPDSRRIMLGLGLANQALHIQAPIIEDKLGISASANYSNSKLLFQMNRHNHEFSHYPVSWDVNLNTVYRYSNNGFVKLFLFREQDNIGVSVAEPGRTNYYAGNNASALYNVLWQHTLSDKLLAKSNIAYSGHTKDDNLLDIDLQTQHQLVQGRSAVEYFYSPKISILTGVDFFRHDENVSGTIPIYDDSTHVTPYPLDVNYVSRRLALYHQWDVMLGDNLQSKTGLRFEAESKTADTFADWRQSFVYKYRKNIDVVLSAGRYHQYPQPDEYDEYIGNPNLIPFQAWHYILGLSYQKDETLFRIEGFYKDYRRLLLRDPNLNLTNNGYGYARGIDFFVKSKWRQLSGRFSTSVLDSKRLWKNAPSLAPTRFDIRVNSIAVLEYAFLPTWTLACNVRWATGKPYTSSIESYHDKRVPNYHRVDLALNHFFALFSGNLCVAYLAVNNIFDTNNIMDYRYSDDYAERVAVKSTIRRTVYMALQTSF